MAAYLDVDLVSSTRTCIKYLYPLLVPGGVLFSQDGHLPLVVQLLNNESSGDEAGCFRPPIHGLGTRKLVRIVKPKPFRKASESTPSGLGAGKVTSTRAAVFRAVYPLLGSMVGVPVWSNLQELIQLAVLEPRPA